MKRAVIALVVGSLVLGGLTLSAEARGWYRGHYGHRGYYGYRGYYGRHGYYGYYGGSGYFLGGFLAGAASALVVDALVTPRVVYGPPVYYGPPVGYAPPVVYGPVYTRAPVCRNVWIPERYEQQARTQNGFTQYYQVRVPGHSQQQCY